LKGTLHYSLHATLAVNASMVDCIAIAIARQIPMYPLPAPLRADNDVNAALRAVKKKMQCERIFREMKRRLA